MAMVNRVNEPIICSVTVKNPSPQPSENNLTPENGCETSQPDSGDKDDPDEPPSSPDVGALVVDATCAPADIRYPTDLDLLNEAREGSEAILDVLYEQVRESQYRLLLVIREVVRPQQLMYEKLTTID